MATLFSLNKMITPAPGQTIVKAGEAAEFFRAEALVEAWKRRSEELDREAEAERERQKRLGYEEGLAAGQREYTEKIMDTVLRSLEYIEGLETTMVKVVGEAVRKIIGELDDDERIVRLVRQALSSVRGEKKVLLRVSLQDEKAVRVDLSVLLSRGSSLASDSSFLDVVGDPRLKPGECFLESEVGVVEASLETQLRNLEAALLNRIQDNG